MIADDAVALPFMIAQTQVRHVIMVMETVTRAWRATLMVWPAYFHPDQIAQHKGSPFVSEHAPEQTVAIDTAFGAIRFIKEEVGTFACVSVDVTIMDMSSGSETENKIEMTVKFAAAPEADTVMAIIDKARRHIVQRLHGTADVVEGKSAAALLFGENA